MFQTYFGRILFGRLYVVYSLYHCTYFCDALICFFKIQASSVHCDSTFRDLPHQSLQETSRAGLPMKRFTTSLSCSQSTYLARIQIPTRNILCDFASLYLKYVLWLTECGNKEKYVKERRLIYDPAARSSMFTLDLRIDFASDFPHKILTRWLPYVDVQYANHRMVYASPLRPLRYVKQTWLRELNRETIRSPTRSSSRLAKRKTSGHVSQHETQEERRDLLETTCARIAWSVLD